MSLIGETTVHFTTIFTTSFDGRWKIDISVLLIFFYFNWSIILLLYFVSCTRTFTPCNFLYKNSHTHTHTMCPYFRRHCDTAQCHGTIDRTWSLIVGPNSNARHCQRYEPPICPDCVDSLAYLAPDKYFKPLRNPALWTTFCACQSCESIGLRVRSLAIYLWYRYTRNCLRSICTPMVG